jgi:ABC-type antimicrobial peptide transport system permease subunit
MVPPQGNVTTCNSNNYNEAKHLGLIKRSIKNITRRKTRAALVIIALSLSMALMVSIPATLSANQKASQKVTDDYIQANNNTAAALNKTSTLIELTNSSSSGGFITVGTLGGTFQLPYIDQTLYDELRTNDKIDAVIPGFSYTSEETVPSTITFGTNNMTINKPAYTLIGVPLDETLNDVLPDNITSGRNLNKNDTTSVVITEDLVEYFHASVGDSIRIYNRTYTVVGVCAPSEHDATVVSRVYMNIIEAQAATNKTGQYSNLSVYTKDAADVDQLVQYIKAKYPGIMTTSYKERLASLQSIQQSQQQMLNSAAATMTQTQATANQEIAVIVVATSTIVFFVMLYTVRERTKEIGTLKAIGFSNGQVMTQFMVEGVVQSAVAGVIGIALGFFVAPLLSGLLLPYVNPLSSPITTSNGGSVYVGGAVALSPITSQATALTVAITPELIAISMGTAVLLGLLGSIYPAWKAAKTRPALAMKYE